ncbi:MAG TPA: hypothetical protein VK754_00560 [Propionibacteriaceae bacterium]|nr:hypothetical protein [Propionibacteriaceae bacterium]
MASLYVDGYRPWPEWVVEGNEEIATKFGAQIGTYRGHADDDHGDMTGQFAADFWFYVNTSEKHDAVLAWFKANAERIGAIYIITRRRIWSVERADEGNRVYTGEDPHTSHIHISYDNEPPEEWDMALSDSDLDRIANRVASKFSTVWLSDEVRIIKAPADSPAGTGPWTTGGTLRFIRDKVIDIEGRLEALETPEPAPVEDDPPF